MEFLAISDELRAHYNHVECTRNDTEFLAEMLGDRFSDVPEDLIWEIACDWTGYSEWE